jgi:preprotein translocase subunit YajC
VTWMIDIAVIAQESSGGGSGGGAGGGAGAGGAGNQMWIGLILMVFVFYGMMLWGGRKDKKRRQDMLNAVKKNDRVMTIGGIIGTVVTVSDTEVTLKVDESANVKITVVRSAIQKVLVEGETPAEVGR